MFSQKLKEKLDSFILTHDGRINKKLGGTPFEAADPSSEQYQRVLPSVKPYMDLTSDEKIALGMYGENVQQYYKQLNQQLRSPSSSELDPETQEVLDYMKNNLLSAVEKLQSVSPKEKTSLTNGVETNVPGRFSRAVTGDFVDQLSRLRPGDTFVDEGFASYTDQGGPTLNMFLSKDKGAKNAVIELKEGAQLKNISPITEFNEGEHLAMPGTQYKLVSSDPKGFYSRKAGQLPMYILEII